MFGKLLEAVQDVDVDMGPKTQIPVSEGRGMVWILDLEKSGFIPKTREEATDPIFKQYVIETVGGNQYAEGVTGVNYWHNVFLSKDSKSGFRSKSEANTFAKAHDLKSYSKKGRGSEGYGDVGAEWNTVKFTRLVDILFPADRPFTGVYELRFL